MSTPRLQDNVADTLIKLLERCEDEIEKLEGKIEKQQEKINDIGNVIYTLKLFGSVLAAVLAGVVIAIISKFIK